MTLESGKARKVSGVIGVASVILVVITLLVGVALQYVGNTGSAASASSNSQPNAGTVAFDPATDLVADEARCVNNHFIKSSSQTVKAGDKNYRQFATAVSIPYAGVTDDAVSKETSTEICGNPTELKMVVDDMMLWTGFPGAEENKAWVKKIQDDINSKGLDAFVLKVTDTKQLIVTDEFQKYAGWVNTVLLRFNTNGEQSLTSVRNWEIPATSDPSTQPIAVQASDPESKPAWVRTLMDKNGKCLYRIGFNAEDKRIETFPCVVPATPGTPPTGHKTPKPTPNKPSTPTTPSTPGCTSNCIPTTHVCPPSTPHGTWPVCKDDPSRDPSQNGNAPVGGGKNADPGPGTYVPPTQVQQPPSTPYTPPAAPVAPAAPGQTPDPAPAPAPEPSAPTPSNPSQGCSPAPGMTTC